MDNNFVKWLDEKISYSSELSQEEIQKLNELYTDVETKKQIVNDTFDAARNNTSGIDFSTDIEKSMSRSAIAQQMLNIYCIQLDQKYNKNETEQINKQK